MSASPFTDLEHRWGRRFEVNVPVQVAVGVLKGLRVTAPISIGDSRPLADFGSRNDRSACHAREQWRGRSGMVRVRLEYHQAFSPRRVGGSTVGKARSAKRPSFYVSHTVRRRSQCRKYPS
jgi:hypothetical protein